MKNHWFQHRKYENHTLFRTIHFWPASWQGWSIFILFNAAIVTNFLRIDFQSHSVSDTLLNFIPETLVMTALLVILCSLTSDRFQKK